ncbi:MAG: hypothetical protein HC847_08870 [Hydrococcus sp. RU_2_2]|nr:hypothetical protein [Hydrococcus sp. RU_2_2]NJP21818.1 hypothetical protein [Hydrococcus sp. CRU_1_1]NJQ98307.1 hypothetical protein [Hydrococcus sp. CSU_1_8]
MTIELSLQDYWDIATETERIIPTCHSDEIDTTWAYPEQLGSGYFREIYLRPELMLSIQSNLLHDDLAIALPAREHLVEISCNLSSGESYLHGSGIALEERFQTNAKEKCLDINIELEAD